jgi:glycosyltransferase involved in cell wall biosynthesis
MKILRVITSMDPAGGGVCQGLRNTIPEMQKLGIQTEVVCLDNPDSAFIKLDSFPVHALGEGKTSWGYHPGLKNWLLSHMADYDHVVIEGLWQYNGLAARKAMEELKRKGSEKIPSLFVMPHGMLDPYFQKADGRKLKAIRNWFYWKLIESKLIRDADAMFFTCEEELRLARTTFIPYTPQEELNLGYGIQEPPAFDERMKRAFLDKRPVIGEQPFILFLSRIHEKKGVDLLINAYEQILEKYAGKKEIPLLVIAGPGIDTPYGNTVRRLVENNLALRGKIIFTGMISGDVKWGAFYGCETFILPSHQENFGIAVAEALACHKSVLISDQVNIWREIKDAGAGIIEKDTLQGTLNLLETWINTGEEERKAMGTRARKAYEAHFAIGQAAARMKEVMTIKLKHA